MKKRTAKSPIPIYSTPGDWVAIMVFPHIFNPMGEWMGWITKDRQVYDVDGYYVGWLSKDPRILRKRVYDKMLPRKSSPEYPGRVRPPASVPLPPMMAELPYSIIDVMDEEPERLHTTDTGELREDME
ncbi:MAG: hypothetical protein JXA97_08390 [Anaerolineales bacterium]|nr:hypothetical protein [Anaerolineales bacterium]